MRLSHDPSWPETLLKGRLNRMHCSRDHLQPNVLVPGYTVTFSVLPLSYPPAVGFLGFPSTGWDTVMGGWERLSLYNLCFSGVAPAALTLPRRKISLEIWHSTGVLPQPWGRGQVPWSKGLHVPICFWVFLLWVHKLPLKLPNPGIPWHLSIHPLTPSFLLCFLSPVTSREFSPFSRIFPAVPFWSLFSRSNQYIYVQRWAWGGEMIYWVQKA